VVAGVDDPGSCVRDGFTGHHRQAMADDEEGRSERFTGSAQSG
jgi:hypothetical protein